MQYPTRPDRVVLPNDAREALRGAGVLVAFDKLERVDQRDHVTLIELSGESDARQQHIYRLINVVRLAAMSAQ